MVENVTLHGGPRHGQALAIPADYGNDLKIDVLVRTQEATGKRSGHYTRVFSVAGKAEHDFEWAGYTSPLVPTSASEE